MMLDIVRIVVIVAAVACLVFAVWYFKKHGNDILGKHDDLRAMLVLVASSSTMIAAGFLIVA